MDYEWSDYDAFTRLQPKLDAMAPWLREIAEEYAAIRAGAVMTAAPIHSTLAALFPSAKPTFQFDPTGWPETTLGTSLCGCPIHVIYSVDGIVVLAYVDGRDCPEVVRTFGLEDYASHDEMVPEVIEFIMKSLGE